tara:strand:- start:23659 stop:24429 length:771 start_codon:yes stop_codon:yes gene_type:complete
MAKLIDCQVQHHRFTPRTHSFKASFFWFELDIDTIDDDFKNCPIISRNRFNVFSFRDDDHIDFNQGSIRRNIEFFLDREGETLKPKRIRLWTNLRCFGYVFNPVSFYLIDMPDDSKRIIMEVGNTFNELKPFLVPASAFKNDEAAISVPKNYYVSPFIALDTVLSFKLKQKDNGMSIVINSGEASGQKILTAALQGEFSAFSTKALVLRLFKHPFVTVKIIALIHWHALLLLLKRVPYISKKDNPHLQQGNMIWKK